MGFNKIKNFFNQELQINCERLQGQILRVNNKNILVLNCYFPVDDGTNNTDDLEYVINIIDIILNVNEHNCILVMGDFNWNPSRNSPHSTMMRNWTESWNLVSG